MRLTHILPVLFLFLFACQTANKEEVEVQQMIETIIESLVKNDYELYNSVLITKDELISHGKKIGYEGNRISEEKILKDVVEPNLRARKLSFQMYKDQKIDWTKVNVDSVQVNSRKSMEVETGKIKVYYQYEGKNCVMSYNGVIRTDSGSFKIGNVPQFGGCVE